MTKAIPINPPLTENLLFDGQGRQITYLRLSITDRCNLRCRYCMPEKGVNFLHHDEVLRYEELCRISKIFLSLGINKIRVTGGEPFARLHCIDFLESLRQLSSKLRIHITTNGVLLDPVLDKLKAMNISGINLSLDSLNRERFSYLSRHDKLDIVLENLNNILALKIPLKINSVVQPDTEDSDIRQIIHLIKHNDIDLRFIEAMPFNGQKPLATTHAHPILKDKLQTLFPDLVEVQSNKIETARRFHLPGHTGFIGIIEGESRSFCSTCNKVRITASGMLKNCLYDHGVLDLKKLLRGKATDYEITKEIQDAVQYKFADGHQVARQSTNIYHDSMATIGG